jgi:hypothetical protein
VRKFSLIDTWKPVRPFVDYQRGKVYSEIVPLHFLCHPSSHTKARQRKPAKALSFLVSNVLRKINSFQLDF